MTGNRPEPGFDRALVTGATGYLGSRLANRLAGAGVAVTAIVRPGSSPERIAELPESVDIATTDGDSETLVAQVSAAAPEVTFHLAARYIATHTPADIPGLIADNVTFTAQVCEATVAAGCTNLVAAGTAWQNAGSPPGNPTPAPNTLYAASKQAADDVINFYAGTSNLNAITLKIYDSYGPGDPRRKFLQVVADAAESGETLRASPGEQRLHMVHVDDLIDGFVHAGNRLASGDTAGRASHTLPSAASVSLRELAAAWQSANGRDVSIEWGATPYRDGEVMTPWEGAPLPGWTPRIDLETGLRSLRD